MRVMRISVAVRLVAHDQDGLPTTPKCLRHLVVERRHTVADVEHEAADIGLLDGEPSLLLRPARQRRHVAGDVTS